MKNLLLLGLFIAFFSFNANAQVTCYGDESKATDFFLENFYYAKCTDYEHGIDHAGGYVFDGNPDYIGPAAWGGIDFPNIQVSKDGMYKVQMTYGIGWCDEQGAWVGLKVNGIPVDQLILYIPEPSPGVIEFEVELYSDYDNLIQILSVKDWPVILGIQIFPLDPTEITTPQTDENTFSTFFADGVLSINNLTGNNNQIQVNSIDGKLIQSVTTSSTSYTIPLNTGLYIVNINGKAIKISAK